MSEEEQVPAAEDNVHEQLTMEKERLDKLYVAYQALETDFSDAKAHIEVLEKDAIDKEIEKEGLEALLNEKDNRIRELEIEGAKAGTRVKHLEPELEKTQEMYTREQARLGRVFEVAEELDTALQTSMVEMKARDDWYAQHMKLFEDLSEAIQTRYAMIDSAVEAYKEFEEKKDLFKDRMEEPLEAAKEAASEMPEEGDSGEEPEEDDN